MKYALLFTFIGLVNTILAQTKVDFYTSQGDFTVELRDDLMPITTANFIKLVDSTFYDSLLFHRVISNFVIQGGDPTGLGTGGPGYTIMDEYHPKMNHDSAGVIAMANKGPNTASAGSQFYLTLSAQPHLDGDYAVFGTCIKGLEIVKKIGNVPTNTSDRPLTDVVMDSLRIVVDSVKDSTITSLGEIQTPMIEVYPNPFENRVAVNYRVEKASHVGIDVFDARGQLILTLEEAHRTKGTHGFQWSPDLPKGIYYLRLQSGGGTQVHKVIKLQ